MSIEVSTPEIGSEQPKDFERPQPYNCQRLGHIMDAQWSPKNSRSFYRKCVIPGCRYVQEKEATG